VAKRRLADRLDARRVKEVDTPIKRRRFASRSAAMGCAVRTQVQDVKDEE